MADQHVTDEEIHDFSGAPPRMPAGIPKATCLKCGLDHEAFYASMAHECRIDFRETRPYHEWILYFQRLGMGVLKGPEARKFPNLDKIITGRTMLTLWFQSDLDIGPGLELNTSIYDTDEWFDVGMPPLANPTSAPTTPTSHAPAPPANRTTGVDFKALKGDQ